MSEFFSDNSNVILAIGIILGGIALLCMIGIIHSYRTKKNSERFDSHSTVSGSGSEYVKSDAELKRSADTTASKVKFSEKPTKYPEKKPDKTLYIKPDKTPVKKTEKPSDPDRMQAIYSFPEDSKLISCPNCGVETNSSDPYCTVCAQLLRRRM